MVVGAKKKTDRLKVFWWRSEQDGIANFGDEITPEIIERLFKIKCEWAPVAECDMVGAGSILEMVLRDNPKGHQVKVWGSGFMQNRRRPTTSRDLDVYAVRGKLTRKRLWFRLRRPAIGDPGLLANMVYERATKVHHHVGVVAHYVDMNNPELLRLRDGGKIFLISPLQSPAEVTRQITSCDLILSSSLHGLIVADSFSVPNYWLPLSDKVLGAGYKFRDYYSATGRQLRRQSLAAVDNEQQIATAIHDFEPITNLKSLQKRLVQSFPYISE